MRKRHGVLLAAASGLFAMVSMAAPAHAAVAPACSSNLCFYPSVDYAGSERTAGVVAGVCYKNYEIQSAVVTFSAKVRFYSGTACSGDYIDKGKGAIANMTAYAGFISQSFKKV
ncbi:hypothetical protein HLK59_33350 [Streptomyces sp. S3(2020)]|uniref:hypothetical protein n=1 Tax=Streptomyces sp. S3(2020) TaxID=2732044 RepID=UPI001489B6FD|nr:hypothetical protein [Streptomyces sp. S3(2020)]NNN35169.1 hypothetical protein [Streptomyces sp. S3(2020)]